MDYNNISLTGNLPKVKLPETSERSGRPYISIFIDVVRASGGVDRIPIKINKSTCKIEKIREFQEAGCLVQVKGKLLTFTKENNKVILIVCVDEIAEYIGHDGDKNNWVEISGEIVDNPMFKATDTRIITTFTIKSLSEKDYESYIPCVCWGHRASELMLKYASGSKITVKGRLQMREYTKKHNGEIVRKSTYEVSVFEYDECK